MIWLYTIHGYYLSHPILKLRLHPARNVVGKLCIPDGTVWYFKSAPGSNFWIFSAVSIVDCETVTMLPLAVVWSTSTVVPTTADVVGCCSNVDRACLLVLVGVESNAAVSASSSALISASNASSAFIGMAWMYRYYRTLFLLHDWHIF